METRTFWYVVAYEGDSRLYQGATGYATKEEAEAEADAKSVFAMFVPGCHQVYRVEPVERHVYAGANGRYRIIR